MKKNILIALCVFFVCTLSAEPVTRNFNFKFNSSADGWVTPGYWSGKIAHTKETAHTGKGSIKVTTTARKGVFSARGIFFGINHKYLAGQKIKIAFYAKGSGEFCAGALVYTRNSKGNEVMNFKYSEPVKLNDQWQLVEYIADFSETYAERIAPIFELRGENAVAYVDDGVFTHLRPPEKMTAITPHRIIKEGDMLPESSFKYSKPATQVNFFAISANRKVQPVTAKAGSGADGVAVFREKVQFPIGEAATVASVNGRQAYCITDILPVAEYARLEKLASTIKIDRPLNVLILGDSLSDRHRGGNHFDKLFFFLNKNNPGKVNFRNAAVNGDFITRVEERMMWKYGKKDVWRLADYSNLFRTKYDIVFIFLGHNDTVANSKNGYKTPFIAPAEAKAAYQRVIAKIRKESPKAKIVLVSPVCGDVAKSRKNADYMVKWGHTGFVLGMPEHVKPYANMLKTLAAENQYRYIDLYTPTRDHANRNALFDNGGVHLTPAGFRLLGAELLKAIAADQSILK